MLNDEYVQDVEGNKIVKKKKSTKDLEELEKENEELVDKIQRGECGE